MSVRIVPASEGMAEAAERLRAGQLVAFPTETVYGLGANARETAAVARIFAAKGRPATNPLIVHVPDGERARELAAAWPETAERLAATFWPGPLTLVLPRTDAIPDIVTAGGETVGLRVPAHPVALELLRRSGVPIAAPSANRSEEISPTTAQHVADSLGPFVDDLLILDSGPTTVGLESTVLDVTTEPPRLLRPGMITAPMLRALLGEIAEGAAETTVARSPGQMLRHYAPTVPLLVIPGAEIRSRLQKGDGLLAYSADFWQYRYPPMGTDGIVKATLPMPAAAAEYAAQLYKALRTIDAMRVTRIIVEEPPHGEEWAAIHDRLRRAAASKQHI